MFALTLTVDGRPIQARFWLEWGSSDLPNSVIPTGADHRESGGLRSGVFLQSGFHTETSEGSASIDQSGTAVDLGAAGPRKG